MARTRRTAQPSAILLMHIVSVFVLCLTLSGITVKGQIIGCFVDADWTSKIRQAIGFLQSKSETATTSSGSDGKDLTDIRNSNANTVLTEIRHPLAITAAVCSNQTMSSPVMLAFMSGELLEVLAAESKILEVPLITALVTDQQDNVVPRTVLNMRPSNFGVLMDLANQSSWTSGIYLGDSKQASLVFMKNYNMKRTEKSSFSLDMAIYTVSNLTDAFTLLNSTVIESGDFFWRVILDVSPRTAEGLADALFKDHKLQQRNFHFLLAALDSEGFEFSKFQGTGWKFTTISLLDSDSDATLSLGREWNQYTSELLTSEAALIIDSLLVGQRTADAYLTWEQRCQQASASCTPRHLDASAVCGAFLEQDTMLRMPSLRSEFLHGFTGPISFTNEGQRVNVTFRITETRHNGSLREVGTWNDVTGLSMNPESNVKSIDRSRPLRVVSVLVEPFLKEVACSDPLSMLGENDTCYKGYHIEFLRHLAHSTNYTYLLHINNEPHIALSDGEWTGVIGEILRGEADLAVVDMSVLSVRQAVVDFTDSFMTDGVSILMRRPIRQKPESHYFSFLQPFSAVTWICILGAFLITSLVVYFVGRLTPNEWETVHEDETTFITNKFTAHETAWSVLSVALSRGYTIKPKSAAARLAHASWFFWCLVIIASYTANLAAFLTVEDTKAIESAADLVKQNHTSYGTPKSMFSTTERFRTSLDPTYHQMWEYMNSRNSFAKNVDDGIAKAQNEPFAFIVQSTVIEFVTNKEPCDLVQVGPILFYDIYGIAVPKGSPLRDELNHAILRLKEQGQMEVMRNKWFRHDTSACVEEPAQGTQRSMSFHELSGVFILLAIGLILALLVAIFELCFLGHKTVAEREKTMIFGEKLVNFILEFVAKQVLGTPDGSDNASKTGDKKRNDREGNMFGQHACRECGQTIKENTKQGNQNQTKVAHANESSKQAVRSEIKAGLNETVPSKKDGDQGIRNRMKGHVTEYTPSGEEIELEVRDGSYGQPSDTPRSERSIKQKVDIEFLGEPSEDKPFSEDFEEDIGDENKAQPNETTHPENKTKREMHSGFDSEPSEATSSNKEPEDEDNGQPSENAHPDGNILKDVRDEFKDRFGGIKPPTTEDIKQRIRSGVKGQVREIMPSKEEIKKNICDELKDQVSEILPPKEEVKKAIRNKIKGQVLKILPSKEDVVQGILNTIKGALNDNEESE